MSIKPFTNFIYRPSLAREITLLLVLKVLALTVMFYMFFDPANRLQVTSKIVGQHLLAPLGGDQP